TFYRFAMITGQGILIIVAGYFESTTGLPTVEMKINAVSNYENTITLSPDSISNLKFEEQLKIVKFPEELNLSTQNIPIEKADSLISFAHQWNLKNGFIKEIQISKNGKHIGQESPGWWGKYVSGKLKIFLKDVFGKKKVIPKKENYAGNTGLIYFRLTGKPEEEVVVNFGSESGDRSIKLVEGNRFVFNHSNWDIPAIAVIQLDKKLKKNSSAIFAARAGDIPLAWTITFFILTGMFLLFFVYHKFILPYPKSDKSAYTGDNSSVIKEFFMTFASFFKKKNIGIGITFILLYRLGESQLVKLAAPFMLDAREVGGLGLTTGEVGIVYGTIGLLSLTVGGIIGGILAAKDGLKKWLWPMIIAINVPNAVYIYLSYAQPDSFLIINFCVALEQFGYGFGFTAFMLYMIYISEGEFKTAHFAIATGFMALGMMIPGMISGWLQEIIGYQHFFIWVLIATLPAFIITKFVPIDPEFGKEKKE
ncbi:MAG: MFS transporter, partial [Ignavibacteria bacterium]